MPPQQTQWKKPSRTTPKVSPWPSHAYICRDLHINMHAHLHAPCTHTTFRPCPFLEQEPFPECSSGYVFCYLEPYRAIPGLQHKVQGTGTMQHGLHGVFFFQLIPLVPILTHLSPHDHNCVRSPVTELSDPMRLSMLSYLEHSSLISRKHLKISVISQDPCL